MEFVLFHREPLRQFVDYLREKGIAAETVENEDVFEIAIPDDVDEELLAEIEERYDELMNLNQALFYEENPPSAENYRAATIFIDLNSGERSAAHVNPDLLGRILEAISEAELNAFVAAIVTAVENPDDRTFCQKVRSGDVDFGDTE